MEVSLVKNNGRIMEEMLIIVIGNSIFWKLKVTKKKSRANRNFSVFKSMLLGPLGVNFSQTGMCNGDG